MRSRRQDNGKKKNSSPAAGAAPRALLIGHLHVPKPRVREDFFHVLVPHAIVAEGAEHDVFTARGEHARSFP